MPKAVELLRQGRKKELWQMCCGFLDLSLEQFMDIQRRQLLGQLELLNHSPLGLKVMRGSRPATVEEFRQQVPLTSYADYCPELERTKVFVHFSSRQKRFDKLEAWGLIGEY